MSLLPERYLNMQAFLLSSSLTDCGCSLRPPPAAYHSATPINNGKKVVFLGGKEWGSSVFLLDAVGVTWSSLEVAGLRARIMHTAVVVTAVEARR